MGHWQDVAHIGVDTRVHGLHQRNVEDFAGPYAGEGGTHFAMNVDYVDVTEFFDAGYPCVDDLARWPTERVPVWFDDAAGGQANHGGVITGFVKRTENRNRVSSCFQGVLLRLDRGLHTTQCWQVVISEHGYMHEPHYTVHEGTVAYKKSEVLWCLDIDVPVSYGVLLWLRSTPSVTGRCTGVAWWCLARRSCAHSSPKCSRDG